LPVALPAKGAWWAVFLYVSLSTLFPPNLAANCELFMSLPYAACAYAVWRVGRTGGDASWAVVGWSATAGVLAAGAVLYKQVGTAIVGVACIYFATLWYVRRITLAAAVQATGLFVLGLATPLAAAGAYLSLRGSSEVDWFWTVEYLRWYANVSADKLSYRGVS
jgi:hypothetical protein